MAVYFKFKSAKDFTSIPIDGHFISVANLKEKIFESKHLGRGTDFDLMVSNAQTNEEYLDEDTLIPKNTSVLVRRIPGRPRMPIVSEREETKPVENKEEDLQPAKSTVSAADMSVMRFPEETDWDEFGNDLYAIPEVLPVQLSNQVQDAPPQNRADEDSKIKALIDTSALDWQGQMQDGFGVGRGFGRGAGRGMMGGRGFGRGMMERKTPPPGYICHRCKVPGHFIQHCPTNGDPNYDVRRVKPPTGIPKSMLMPTPDGSYALPSGAVAVLRPNEAAFEKEIEGLPSTRSVTEIPPELRCPLCREVMQDAVLTSKCCFRSFCDKCIRDHIISKLACVCGATSVLADDLLPNKTVRETINRLLESSNNSAENAGSMLQIPDMESARPAPPKVPSPTLSATSKGQQMPTRPAQSIVTSAAHSATSKGEQLPSRPSQPIVPSPTHSAASKGEQMPLTEKDETLDIKEISNEIKHALDVKEISNETKHVGNASKFSLEKERATKIAGASEATHESTMKELTSQGSAPLAEEEVQQKPSVSEQGKKKKKKKARLPANELQWRTPQDVAAENYMMPFPPQSCDPYWGNMQLGMDGFMNPYSGTMPYMGYVPGPFDVPMCGMLPQDPFGGQGYMMPVVPPQMGVSDFAMGSNLPPPVMRREEFEARKAELRRKREIERCVERDGYQDQKFGRDVSSSGDVSSMKSKHRQMSQPTSSDHHHHHRSEREASLERLHHHRRKREASPERAHHHHHHRSQHHREEREISPERSHHHHRCHRQTESPPPLSRDIEYVGHGKKRTDHHDPPPSSRDPEPIRKRRTEHEDKIKDTEITTTTTVSTTLDTDKKQKPSVFSRISFPEETRGNNKKRKISSSSENGYKDPLSSISNGHHDETKGSVVPSSSSSIRKSVVQDHDSSDDERHFKRKPSRYEPSPPSPVEWEEDVRPSRSSRDRGHKHR